MNWLQKIAQLLPPTYMGMGHNYRWNEDQEKYEELWAAKDSGDVIIWYYKDGQITEQDQYGPHWVDRADAKGRIETGKNRGSVTFDNKNIEVQQRVLEDLIQKYPGIRFGIYEQGGPFSLQQYWDMIS